MGRSSSTKAMGREACRQRRRTTVGHLLFGSSDTQVEPTSYGMEVCEMSGKLRATAYPCIVRCSFPERDPNRKNRRIATPLRGGRQVHGGCSGLSKSCEPF